MSVPVVRNRCSVFPEFADHGFHCFMNMMMLVIFLYFCYDITAQGKPRECVYKRQRKSGSKKEQMLLTGKRRT